MTEHVLDDKTLEIISIFLGLFFYVFFFGWWYFDHKAKKQKKELRKLNDRIAHLEKQIKDSEKWIIRKGPRFKNGRCIG